VLNSALRIRFSRFAISASFQTARLSKIQIFNQLLSREANSYAAKGEMGLAAQSLLDGLRLARSLKQEPLFVFHLVQIASVAIIRTGLESVLNRKALEKIERMAVARNAQPSRKPMRPATYVVPPCGGGILIQTSQCRWRPFNPSLVLNCKSSSSGFSSCFVWEDIRSMNRMPFK
jgi:hypothetical protein